MALCSYGGCVKRHERVNAFNLVFFFFFFFFFFLFFFCGYHAAVTCVTVTESLKLAEENGRFCHKTQQRYLRLSGVLPL